MSPTTTVGKLYVKPSFRTSAGDIRADLDDAEQQLLNLQGMGPQAVSLLHLFDRINRRLQELDDTGVDLRVERTRFATLGRQLKRRQGDFLREVGPVLGNERQRTQPSPDHWWWFLDREQKASRRRRWLKVAGGALTVAVLLAGLWRVYQLHLAPPPEAAQAYRRLKAGQSALEEGQRDAALEDFVAATELTPEDAEAWLWRGVLHETLGQVNQAQKAYAEAELLIESRLDFHLDRGRIYLQAGMVSQAASDASKALSIDPDSGWAHFLRAGVSVAQNDYRAAMTDLERARALASKEGDGRLQSLAATQLARLISLDQTDPSQ